MSWSSKCREPKELLTFAVLLAMATGCEKSNVAAEKKAAPPVKVEIATPTEKEVTDFHEFTG